MKRDYYIRTVKRYFKQTKRETAITETTVIGNQIAYFRFKKERDRRCERSVLSASMRTREVQKHFAQRMSREDCVRTYRPEMTHALNALPSSGNEKDGEVVKR